MEGSPRAGDSHGKENSFDQQQEKFVLKFKTSWQLVSFIEHSDCVRYVLRKILTYLLSSHDPFQRYLLDAIEARARHFLMG